MTLPSMSLSKIRMVLCKILDDYLTRVQVSKESIRGLRRYWSLNNFNQDIQSGCGLQGDNNSRIFIQASENWPCRTREKPNFLSGINIILFKKFTLFAVYYHMIMEYVVHHLSCHSIYTLCWTNLLYQKNSKN